MGLDMYLSANKYISGWDHNKPEVAKEFNRVAIDFGMAAFITPHAPSGYLKFNVAYWRKANHIHKWFVANVQNGTDDCGQYSVEREQLKALRDLCQEVLDHPKKAKDVLPTEEGFFFGSTEYNEDYRNDLKDTINQIDRVLKIPDEWDFEYRSSW